MYLSTKWDRTVLYGPSAAVFTRQAVRFCSRAVRLFPAPLA